MLQKASSVCLGNLPQCLGPTLFAFHCQTDTCVHTAPMWLFYLIMLGPYLTSTTYFAQNSGNKSQLVFVRLSISPGILR